MFLRLNRVIGIHTDFESVGGVSLGERRGGGMRRIPKDGKGQYQCRWQGGGVKYFIGRRFQPESKG